MSLWFSSDLVRRIDKAQNLDELVALFESICQTSPLTHIVYATMSPLQSEDLRPLVATYPREWIERYRTKGFQHIDPVIGRGRTATFPFDWADLEKGSPRVRDLFREAASFEVGRNGITFPFLGPSGRRALFNVTSDLSDEAWSELRWSNVRQMEQLGRAVHNRIIALIGASTGGTGMLSAREEECLSLLLRGATPKQAAGELGISDNRARMLLQQACRKLRCKTPTQAVAKAVSLSLIT